MKIFILPILSLFSLIATCDQKIEEKQVEVLVIGGGTGGTAAGLQAARLGARTLIAEPSPWLGGMLTAAGVSAIDGNHRLPSGIWGEFRRKIWEHYGGPDSVATGWVSNTLFEPSVGARILDDMARAEPNLEVWNNTQWEKLERSGDSWIAMVKRNGKTVAVKTRILIDGTDLGDVAAAAGAGYDLGMDARAETGEDMAPEKGNNIIQDLTYVAILKDYGPGADKTIARPENYRPEEFHCSCRTDCDREDVVDCAMMLNYGKLPNKKYMINWPNHGNDYYVNMVEMTPAKREEALKKAKAQTLAFVYYIQTELGFPHLSLADDEFPTGDLLALMPYHREGRRIHGLARLTVNHILDPHGRPDKLYRTGIAVGDYPIDHHHKKNPDAPHIDFPPVPSFNVPLGCLIPRDVDGLLIADKAVSVTNIVNGSTRLQPVVLQIGQAAGCLAAMAVKEKISPRNIPVRKVQEELLRAGVFLMPFLDVQPTDPHFAAIQRVGVAGILKGTGIPFQWANQTWFYPDSSTTATDFATALGEYEPAFQPDLGQSEAALTIEGAIALLAQLISLQSGKTLPGPLSLTVADQWEEQWELTEFNPRRPIARRELAVMIDRVLNPFFQKDVNFDGSFQN